jgi:hypothetical protein
VFAAPAETGTDGERDFHDRRGIGENTPAVGSEFLMDGLGKALEPLPQHLVIVTPERIARDVA